MAESGRPSALAARERGIIPADLRDFSQIRARPIGARLERRDLSSREALLRRIRGEFDDMPGLRVSLRQACRLFGLCDDVCTRILDGLVASGFLKQTPVGQYGRRDVT